MKKFQKILSLLLCAAMILSAAPVSAGAASGAVIRPSGYSAYPGDTISIPIYADNLDQMAALYFELYYDPDVLSFETWSTGWLFDDPGVFPSVNGETPGLVRASIAAYNGISGSGEIFWFTFSVKSEASLGDTRLQISVGEAYHTNLTPIEATGAESSISVLQRPVPEFYTYLSADTDVISKGESVTFTLYNSWYRPLSSGSFEIIYDSALFSVTSAAFGGEIQQNSTSSLNTSRLGVIRAAFASNGGDLWPYDLMTFTLTAIADTDISSSISASASSLYDSNRNPYTNTSCSSSVSITKLPEDLPSYVLTVEPGLFVMGDETAVCISLEEGAGVGAGDFTLEFDPTLFRCVDVKAPEGLGQTGGQVIPSEKWDTGKITFSYVNTTGSTKKIPMLELTLVPLRAPETHYEIRISASGVVSTQLDENDRYIPVLLNAVNATGCIYTGETVDPTCTTQGSTVYTCSACQHSFEDQIIPPLGHEMTFQDASEANCIAQGNPAYFHCSRCGNNFADEAGTQLIHNVVFPIDPDNHIGEPLLKKELAPTCTAKGYSGDFHCSSCDAVLTTGQTLDPLGHDYSIHVATVPPTCEAEGYTTYHCSRCDSTENREIVPALGHSYGNPSFLWSEDHSSCNTQRICANDSAHVEQTNCEIAVVHSDASCTEKGETVYTATVTLDGKLHTDRFTLIHDALGHDILSHEAKAPTCTEIGWNAYVTCSRCDYTTYEELEALGHGEIHHDAQSVTCTEIGWDAYVTCNRCNYSTYEEIEALGHDEIRHDAQAVTCTGIGWDEYETCTRCNYTTYVEIPALGHSAAAAVKEKEIYATCTTDGSYDSVVYCKTCGFEMSRETILVEATGDHVYAAVKEQRDPSCTEDGYVTKVCGCGATDTTVLTAIGHNYLATVTAPTCLEKGFTTHVCANCQHTYRDSETEALGHAVVSHEAQAPTCTEIGWNTYVTCNRCDYTTYAEIVALGHDEISHDVKAATCTEIGWNAYVTCSRCDYSTYAEIVALGHDEISHDAQAVTCTEIGWNAYVTCSRCDYTTYKELAALGHTEQIVPGKPATETETGLTEGKKCSVCGEILVKQEIIDKLKPSHVHDYKPLVTAPTCTEKGYTTYTCACGDSYTAEETPATGHSFGSWHTTLLPSVGKTGEAARSCACGAVETKVLEALSEDFIDVEDGAWFQDAVAWAATSGVTTGTGPNTFSPDNDCTREQVVTFLWRAAGSPKISGSLPFHDVKETDYFYQAVLWAKENGITTGVSNTEFGVGVPCSRAMVVTLLWRTANQPKPNSSVNPFTDVASNQYYYSAVLWAVEKGITNGMGPSSFAPDGVCKRSQIVTFLYRYFNF